MSQVTYYFDSYDSGGEEWDTNPQYMVDGNTGNYAGNTTSSQTTQLLLSNTCPGTELGDIEAVEIRATAYYSGSGVPVFLLHPVFSGTDDGDTHYPAEFMNDWADITTDTNAPSPWTWSDIQDLDIDIIAGWIARPKYTYVSIVEVRVTYSAAEDIGIRVKSGSGIIQVGTIEVEATSKLRIRKGSTTYEMVMVNTSDPDASPIRIYDGSSIKALMDVS